jgi:hypothetical protein
MSTKTLSRKDSRQYRNYCDEEFRDTKNERQRDRQTQRRNKSKRRAYESGE